MERKSTTALSEAVTKVTKVTLKQNNNVSIEADNDLMEVTLDLPVS